MPRFISDGKAPEDLPDFLETGEHAGIDHSALPGVLSSAAHAAVDHTGLPGVGDLSVAAHAALNHSGIPGIGLAGTQVLAPGVTEAQIQAALNTAGTYVVFLLPGNYAIGSSILIDIPSGKALIGLGGTINRHNISPSYSTSTHAVFQVATHASGSNPYIRVNSSALLRNVVINGASSVGSNSGYAVEAGNGACVEDVIVDRWMTGGSTTGAAVYGFNGTRFKNILVYQAKNFGFYATSSNGGRPVVFEHCVAYDCDNTGFRLSNAVHLTDCYAYANTGNGFRGEAGCTYQQLTNCTAESNSADGFNWVSSNAGDGTLLTGCFAITNSAWGFNLTAATPNRPGIVGCSGRGNTTGNFNVGGGWQAHALWNG